LIFGQLGHLERSILTGSQTQPGFRWAHRTPTRRSPGGKGLGIVSRCGVIR
jgi:hypothetical protein